MILNQTFSRQLRMDNWCQSIYLFHQDLDGIRALVLVTEPDDPDTGIQQPQVHAVSAICCYNGIHLHVKSPAFKVE